MRHSRATLQPLNVPQQFCATPLGNITASKCSPTEPRDTLGRRYSPKTFPNSSARHPWATLQAHIVPQQGRATPSGNTSPLFRRRNVRIDPVMNMLGDTFGTAYTLGRHYKPISFHNRVIRHSRATLLPLNVPQQFCATPLGDVTAPKTFPNSSARHPRATLCPFFVAGESALIPPRISSETPSAPLGDITSLYRSTTGPRDTLGRHYCPQTFPNSSARHPRATLCHFFVAGEFALKLS